MTFKKLRTPEFRVSYPSVFEPTAYDETKPKMYELIMLFPKTTDLSALKKAAHEAAVEKFGAKLPANLKSPFNDGNLKVDEDGNVKPGYKDMIWMRVRSKTRPNIVEFPEGPNGPCIPITDPQDFYGGCWAEATVNVWAYDKAGGKGVSFSLLNILKTRDDESFGLSRSSAEADFRPEDWDARTNAPEDDCPF